MVQQKKRYTAKVTRDQVDGWIAEVKELAGVRTSVRTLESLSERVRDAIAAAGGPAGELWIEWPLDIARLLIANDQARGKASAAEQVARAQMTETARGFQKLGLSLRDTAHVMAISHQRVQQLLSDARTYRDKSVQRHEDDDGEMAETSRRYAGITRWENGPEQRLDHVFGECKKCGALGRWVEPNASAPVMPRLAEPAGE